MQRSYLDFPEAAAKVVERLCVYTNPPAGRKVHIEFTDGTAISIEIDVRSAISGRYYRTNQGDIEIIQERRDPPFVGT